MNEEETKEFIEELIRQVESKGKKFVKIPINNRSQWMVFLLTPEELRKAAIERHKEDL